MTTTIKSSESERRMTLDLSDGDAVITIFSGDVIAVDATAFLDAVRSELGVLIIDKADLPEVTVEGNSALVGVGHGPLRISASARRSTVSEMRRTSLAYLALAEYLEAHPPVDEQQVEALAGLIRSAGEAVDSKEFARRLVATGKVTVQS